MQFKGFAMNTKQLFLMTSATLALSLGQAPAGAQSMATQEPAAGRFASLRALPLEELSRQRGGQDLSQVLGTARLSGVVSDNSATNLGTGSNMISDGEFANAVGMPVVIQNSGNNVLIQSSTIVNVQLK